MTDLLFFKAHLRVELEAGIQKMYSLVYVIARRHIKEKKKSVFCVLVHLLPLDFGLFIGQNKTLEDDTLGFKKLAFFTIF